LRVLAAGGLLAAVIGCSGDGVKVAPVSGVVKLDGVPYPRAVVSFQPVGTAENPNPGKGSSAYTDENGRFVLRGADGEDGAVVGKHVVRIMTRGNDVVGQSPEGGSPDGGPKGPVDPIPPEWNSNSNVEFEVPSRGSDAANFDITSRKKGGVKK
jgi:hypothetical protein